MLERRESYPQEVEAYADAINYRGRPCGAQVAGPIAQLRGEHEFALAPRPQIRVAYGRFGMLLDHYFKEAGRVVAAWQRHGVAAR